MTNKDDPRFIQSERAICDALARLLEGKTLLAISMSELAREAGVSRGTLYAHFNNVSEVYERSVERFYDQTQTLDEHFSCASCKNDRSASPFCERLREAGPFASVVHDERFLPTTMRCANPYDTQTLESKLRAAGISARMAHAIYLFQMSGCYSVATTTEVDHDEWRRYQETLDRFIQGGLAALGVELQ